MVVHPSYPTPTRTLNRPPKDIAETVVEEEEAKFEDDMPICDPVEDQDKLKGPQPGQSPVVINAINIPGRTSDEDDGDVVCDSVSDQLERKSKPQRDISTLLPATADIDTPVDVMEDITVVRDQS